MNVIIVKQVLAVVLLVSVHSLTWAKEEKASKSPLLITLSQKHIVVDAKGNETLENVTKVKPGDILEYSAIYHNRSKQALSGVKASLPVPKGLIYIKQSAKPSAVQASTDGVKYAAEPLKRMEKLPSGKEQEVDVPYAEYRGLQWQLGEFPANKQVTVSARMRVIETETAKSPEELVNPNSSK